MADWQCAYIFKKKKKLWAAKPGRLNQLLSSSLNHCSLNSGPSEMDRQWLSSELTEEEWLMNIADPTHSAQSSGSALLRARTHTHRFSGRTTLPAREYSQYESYLPALAGGSTSAPPHPAHPPPLSLHPPTCDVLFCCFVLLWASPTVLPCACQVDTQLPGQTTGSMRKKKKKKGQECRRLPRLSGIKIASETFPKSRPSVQMQLLCWDERERVKQWQTNRTLLDELHHTCNFLGLLPFFHGEAACPYKISSSRILPANQRSITLTSSTLGEPLRVAAHRLPSSSPRITVAGEMVFLLLVLNDRHPPLRISQLASPHPLHGPLTGLSHKRQHNSSLPARYSIVF